ncbi:hypothetical protein Pmani_014111 [Petrolisthes manimaculis]|uniref:Uncharacterized protein n=1 Tax=Petrolisthes manimaculis TaxID=1843537 RepID=A0AAE1PTI0_9EUCA|nr:hypothetical protein Pmani_014111 [Petrolisthes manimaculis]
MIIEMPDGYRTPGPPLDLEPGQTTMSPHLGPPHPAPPHHPFIHVIAGAGTPPYMAGGGGHSPSGPVAPHPMPAPFPYSEPLPPYQTPMSKLPTWYLYSCLEKSVYNSHE